jgi:hypothetical protein
MHQTAQTLVMTVALVPTDYPQRLAKRGLNVQVMGDWQSCGGSADHAALVLHHTASSSSTKPADDAAYCHHGSGDAPLYNVMVDRTGVVWVLTRRKSNNAGKISGTALNEALRGQAQLTPAAQRGLADTTSANSQLFGISAQNNGTGEWWSDALVDAMCVVADETLKCLGLSVGHVSTHRTLTARKIDTTDGQYGVPANWHSAIQNAGGYAPAPPQPEEDEMWTIVGEVPAGTSREQPGSLTLALPAGRKSAKLQMYAACPPSQGVSLWAAQCLDGKNFGMWSKGNTWEQWLNGSKQFTVDLMPEAYAVQFQHMGGTKAPLVVSISGT